VNASGPRRYGYGTLRDYVIGISFMNDEGQEVKAGGRVVKNVAGYDICKLQIGALGTLGIITQVTLKVKPRPAASALLCMPNIRIHELEARIEQVVRTQTRPIAVDAKLSRPPDESVDSFSFWVLFEDSEEATTWQVKQLKKEWQGAFVDALAPHLMVESAVKLTNDSTASVSFRANVPNSAVAEFMRAAIIPGPQQMNANAGNGIVYGNWQFESPLEWIPERLKDLRQFAVRHHGNLVITRCPAEWKRELPIWGEPRGDWALMQKVKQAIDPKNLFNPGRFIVG
jgi:glycolate oxidase FAD binding subunit